MFRLSVVHPASPLPHPGLAAVCSSRFAGESFRSRVERLFSQARPVIMDSREFRDEQGRLLRGQTMTWEDWRIMTGNHPDVERVIDLFRNNVADILREFDLHDYHAIPADIHLMGRPEDSLCEKNLLDTGAALRTDPNSRIVLHPDTWAKLDMLAREFVERFGEPVTLASGYRSDAYQLYLLAYNASRIDDPENPGRKLMSIRLLEDVFRTVAPSGCSEHSIRVPAFDVRNWMDRPHDLRSTEQWIWFRDRAAELGIVESYPVGSINQGYGEPWHFCDRETLGRM